MCLEHHKTSLEYEKTGCKYCHTIYWIISYRIHKSNCWSEEFERGDTPMSLAAVPPTEDDKRLSKGRQRPVFSKDVRMNSAVLPRANRMRAQNLLLLLRHMIQVTSFAGGRAEMYRAKGRWRIWARGFTWVTESRAVVERRLNTLDIFIFQCKDWSNFLVRRWKKQANGQRFCGRPDKGTTRDVWQERISTTVKIHTQSDSHN